MVNAHQCSIAPFEWDVPEAVSGISPLGKQPLESCPRYPRRDVLQDRYEIDQKSPRDEHLCSAFESFVNGLDNLVFLVIHVDPVADLQYTCRE